MLAKLSKELSSDLGCAMQGLLDYFYTDLSYHDVEDTRFFNLLPANGRRYYKKHPYLLKEFIEAMVMLASKTFSSGKATCGNYAEQLLLSWVIKEVKMDRDLRAEEALSFTTSTIETMILRNFSTAFRVMRNF